MKKTNQKGFTLIELLVVIAIIGLLSTLAVISLNNARQKARDARRVSDIKQVQTALELYFADSGAYPTGTDLDICGLCISTGNGIAATCAAAPSATYMSKAPSDPLSGQNYEYTRDSVTSYSIDYTLEGQTEGIAAGLNTATPAGLDDK